MDIEKDLQAFKFRGIRSWVVWLLYKLGFLKVIHDFPDQPWHGRIETRFGTPFHVFAQKLEFFLCVNAAIWLGIIFPILGYYISPIFPCVYYFITTTLFVYLWLKEK